MEQIKKLCASRYKDYFQKPFQLTDGQSEIFEIITKRKYPRNHCMAYTRYGKSETVAMATLTRITTFPEKWAIVAPSGKKAHIIMSALINHTFDNEYTMAMFDVAKGESLDRIRRERSKDRMTFRHPDGSIGEVFTLSSEGKRTNDLLDALMGFGSPNIILDESSLIDDIQHAGVFRMLGDQPDNFLFEIGNPLRRNHFLKTSLDPAFHHINIPYSQGILEGRITEEFIEEMRMKPMFAQLYENKFPPQDAVDNGGFTPLYNDEELKLRMKPDIELFGELRMGCDVAGEGSNYSVIVLRGKNGAKILYKAHTPDTMTFVGVIVQKFRETQPKKIYIDKVGIGKPVFDRLRELPEISELLVGVQAGESPRDSENYFNKRAEMFWRQRDWLVTSYLEGNDWIDLLDIRYKIQSDKKIKIKGKDEMIRDGIMSPDVADALSLTFYDSDNISNRANVYYAQSAQPTQKYPVMTNQPKMAHTHYSKI
jgi:hypothetical protein